LQGGKQADPIVGPWERETKKRVSFFKQMKLASSNKKVKEGGRGFLHATPE